MKSIIRFTALAALLLSLVGCSAEKTDDVRYITSFHIEKYEAEIEGTSGTSDFSNISAVVNLYLGKNYFTEDEVLAAYNDILSKTRDAEYYAPGDSFYKITIIKSVANQSNTGFINDPTYKAPAHIWDIEGSRDL